MTKIIRGPRVGKDGALGVGCSAAIFDENREKILLVQRSDNGRWAVPGGYMEPGENFYEACAREVYEETGLRAQVSRLISMYTNPDILLEYPDGNRWQLVVLHFEAGLLGGELRPSDETTAFRYFSLAEIPELNMGRLDRYRVEDAFAQQACTIVRNEFDF